MIQRVTLYDIGVAITKATFIGFCQKELLQDCKHKSCGYTHNRIKPLKCKMNNRFRSLTVEELANPKTDIEYAILELQFAGSYGDEMFVVDLKNQKFINVRVTINSQGKKWVAYPGDFATSMDMDAVVNCKHVIEQIGKVM